MLTAKIISTNNTLPYCHVQMIATKIRFKSNSKTLVLTCNYNGSFCIYVNLEIVYFCNVIFTRISSYNKGWHTCDVLENCPVFKTPHPACPYYIQYTSTPLTLDVHIQTNPTPSPNDNQSIKRTHNPRMTIICYQVLSSGWFFRINSLIFSGFPWNSFNLAEASLSAFLWLCILVCAVVQKYYQMSFIYNYSHF